MDNVNQPMGQGPQEHPPTQPFRFTPGWPGGAQGAQGGQDYGPPPGGPQWQQAGQGPQPPKPKKNWKQEWKRSKRVRWTAGITAAALLGAGGAVAGLALAGSGGSSGSNSASAAALNSAIGGTSSTSAKCPTPVAGSVHRQTGKHGCLRLAIRRIHGMYGQVAFHTSSGTETLAFERGQVVSDSGGVLVVKARNGTEWSWHVASNSLVREGGKQVSGSQLTSGAKVFVGGQVIGSDKDARLIVIRPQNASNGSSPNGSSSSNSSSSNSASGSSSGSAT